MTTREFLSKISWELLKIQKGHLLELRDTTENTEYYISLSGIINMIDYMQDYAVDSLGIEESVVFDMDKDA